MFHSDISGNDFNEEQPENILFILLTSIFFHFEMSGNDFNEEQLKNIKPIQITVLISN